MLAACGCDSTEDLYSQLPEAVRLNRPLAIAAGNSEYDIVDYFRAWRDENANGYASFLGAGVYHHFRPVLVDVVVSRGEFLTSYTPYQAEIAQGTLTTIFEFQTMICQLTGMDVANASMYDGSTAVPEAAHDGAAHHRHATASLVARTVHPEYREVLRHVRASTGHAGRRFGYDRGDRRVRSGGSRSARSTTTTAAVIVQSPNFFGVVENVKAAAEHCA